MPTIRLNLLALQTFDRLMATIHFLEVLDKAIPDAERQDQEALRRLAEEQQWDFGDYSGERQIIEGNHRWLPRFAAYSVVILLYSIVETQLLAVAERVGTNQGSTFRVTDIRGRGIEQDSSLLEASRDIRRQEGPGVEDGARSTKTKKHHRAPGWQAGRIPRAAESTGSTEIG